MESKCTEVQDAINQSILQDEIIHMDYTEALNDELISACEDYTKNGAVVEFWGTEDGNDWRIHLDRDVEEPAQ